MGGYRISEAVAGQNFADRLRIGFGIEEYVGFNFSGILFPWKGLMHKVIKDCVGRFCPVSQSVLKRGPGITQNRIGITHAPCQAKAGVIGIGNAVGLEVGDELEPVFDITQKPVGFIEDPVFLVG